MNPSNVQSGSRAWRPSRAKRERQTLIDTRLIDHLARSSFRLNRTQSPKEIAEAIRVPYSTLTAALRRLEVKGQISHVYLVNPFRTRYCHEFLLSMALNHSALAQSKTGWNRKQVPSHRLDSRDRGPMDRFVGELLAGLEADADYRKHLIVTDVVMLHGAPDRDVEFTIVTDDGSYSIGRWVRNRLSGNPGIRQMHTLTVGYRASANGYSGEHANGVSNVQ